ncbi:MAG: hypothetical protein LCH38_12610 [Proteobacteria bacterium]|nr:hypothetical protein [Pseudomonadota bacterium]
MLRQFAVVLTAFAGTSVFAADIGIRKPGVPAAPHEVSSACKETKGLPADAFGFATGSDVADLGSWGLGLDTTTAIGQRGGSMAAFSPTIQLSGSFFPCLEIGPYLNGSYTRFRAYGGGTTTTVNAGGGIEMKYKLLGRAPNGIGLTFALSPGIQATDPRPGANGTLYSNSYRLLADAEIMPGRLYGAMNIELIQNWASIPAASTRASFFNVRGALTSPVQEGLYLGAEASYQRGYSGNWLNRYTGSAVYLGPTFFWQINEKFSLNGTWAYQVAGDAKAAPGRALGIDIFARHQMRAKLGYSF